MPYIVVIFQGSGEFSRASRVTHHFSVGFVAQCDSSAQEEVLLYLGSPGSSRVIHLSSTVTGSGIQFLFAIRNLTSKGMNSALA